MVQWSGIQNVLEQAESDVLILLDCCHSRIVHISEGNGVTELISACAYNAIANGVGYYSFTKEVATELRDLSVKPSFTVAELYRNIFSRIQCHRPEDGRERHPPPIQISLTQDNPQFPRSIQLSVRFRLSNQDDATQTAPSSETHVGMLNAQDFPSTSPASALSNLTRVEEVIDFPAEVSSANSASSSSTEVPRIY